MGYTWDAFRKIKRPRRWRLDFTSAGLRRSPAFRHSNCEHECARGKEAYYQIPQSWGERMRTICQIANHEGSSKPAQVPHRIDQPNRRGGSRLAQKQRGHCPKAGLETVKTSPDHNEERD